MRKRKWEETQNNKARLVIYRALLFYQTPKTIPGSIHTFWYEGFAENKGKHKVGEKVYISRKKNSLSFESWFVEEINVAYNMQNMKQIPDHGTAKART